MSIYQRKGVCFHRQLRIGERGEEEIIRYLETHYPNATIKRVNQPGHDIEIKQGGKLYRLEIKSHQNKRRYSTFVSEITQNTDTGSLSNVIANPTADYVIQYDAVSGFAFIYDGPSYRRYLVRNKHNQREFPNATASGILTPWKHKPAGFLGKWRVKE